MTIFIVPDIEFLPRMEIHSLIRFICYAKQISYSDANKMVQEQCLQGTRIDSNNEDEWCKELVAYLKSEKIDFVEIY